MMSFEESAMSLLPYPFNIRNNGRREVPYQHRAKPRFFHQMHYGPHQVCFRVTDAMPHPA
jgi:hypothetical protein